MQALPSVRCPLRGFLFLLSLCGPPALGQSFLQCSANAALDFDGVDDCVQVPFDPSFPTERFTVTAWIRQAWKQTPVGLVHRGEGSVSDNNPWGLELDADGTFQVVLEDASDFDVHYDSEVLVADELWHHLAAVRSADKRLKLFVDGVLRASFLETVVPSPNNDQTITIGCCYHSVGPGQFVPLFFARGRIDEVAMWSRALSDAEIGEVWQTSVDRGSPDLKGYWTFDEGSGQTALDLSPAGNHGFLGKQTGVDSADPARLSYAVCPLAATPPSVSLAGGGLQVYLLEAGAAHGGSFYLVAMSASGTSPGLPLGPVVLPLQYDGLFLASLSAAAPPFHAFQGLLTPSGDGLAAFGVPSGAAPGLAGLTLYAAYLLWDPPSGTVTFASNAVSLTLAP